MPPLYTPTYYSTLNPKPRESNKQKARMGLLRRTVLSENPSADFTGAGWTPADANSPSVSFSSSTVLMTAAIL